MMVLALAVATTFGTLFLFTPRASSSPPPFGIIDTYAGGPGHGPASQIDMMPVGLEFRAGRLYVADNFWNVVRAIDVATGEATIVAGTGTHSSAGLPDVSYPMDGGPATQAQLSFADRFLSVASGTVQMTGTAANADIVLGPGGELYIADPINRRIRRVDSPTGIITSIAGTGAHGTSDGPAISTAIGLVQGMARDSQGNIYFTEWTTHLVRIIDAATGQLSTFAGTATAGFSGDGGPASAAQLNTPQRLAIDTNDNLYIADRLNNRIRKVDLATGTITTVAGNGQSAVIGPEDLATDGFLATQALVSGPGGVAIGPDGSLYISQPISQLVRKVDATTGIINTVAGIAVSGFSGDGGAATSAQLYLPYDVAVGDNGDVYIADWYNRRIRAVSAATGIITTLAGNGEIGYGADGGPATAAQVGTPTGVAIDASGNLFIADNGAHRVRRVDATTGTITTIAGTGVPAYGGDGGPATAATLFYPAGVAVDSSGNVFVTEWGSAIVRKIDAQTGIITTYAGTPGIVGQGGDGGAATSATMQEPWGIAIDDADNIYIADQRCRVRKVDAATGTISTIAGGGTCTSAGDGGPATMATFSSPSDIAIDASGNLFIADSGVASGSIRRIDAATGIITAVASPVFPRSVAVDRVGNLYMTDGNSVIYVKDVGATGLRRIAGTSNRFGGVGDGGPAVDALLRSDYDLAIDPKGYLYLAERYNWRVRRITLDPAAINPSVPAPSVVSRKTHGTVGDFDIDLPLAGNLGIECRTGGANGDYTLVFSFANTLTSVGGAGVTTGSGSVTSGTIGMDAHQYIVNLTGVGNAQTVTISLTNVSDSAGNFSSALSASMGVLLSDTNASGEVNSSDIGQTKANSGQTTDGTNFRADVNVNGVINSSDIGTVKAKSGTSLP